METRVSDNKLASLPRITTLISSVIVALSSGTNYIYSAYAPQLAARLRISHTKLNIIGLAGNIGVYSSGPFWGRIVDRRGPRILLACGFAFLLIGYSGIYHLYNGADNEQAGTNAETFSYLSFITLIFCAFLTGAGGNGGLTSSVNATAKSFPDELRATTTGLVLSGFGLSAFYFSALTHLLFPGDTSSFLLLLAVGTSFPMILGFFLVRPIPLSVTNESRDVSRRNGADIPNDGYAHSVGVDAVLGSDALVFEHRNDSRTTLLSAHYHGSSHLQDTSAYTHEDHGRVTNRARSLELAVSPSRGEYRQRSLSSVSHRRNRSRVIEVMQDLHGKALLSCPDFWLLFSLLSLLSGTGLMYINNVGSISQALFAQGNPDFDPAESVKWQGMQVSIISVANCLGRVLSGVGADLVKNRFSAPRTYCIVFIAMLFVLSQAIAAKVDNVQDLWHASALLGLAYGGMFGIFPTITIEWFGLGHFSENWGLVSLSPMIGGNIFSIAFGRNLDAHAPEKSDHYNGASSKESLAGGVVSNDQCFTGRECYVSSLYLTTLACVAAVCLSVLAAWKDRQRMIVKPTDYQEIIWEETAEDA